MLSATKIKSDEGFFVTTYAHKIAYQSGEHSVDIESEIVVDPYGYALYVNSIKKWEPDGNIINASERRTIADNVKKALEFAGYICEIA